MNRRLQQFLELEQLSPARLADILGIQRSGISHILSGRNKPGYDFINKFLLKFPNINSEWLITGKGKPYKDSSQQTATSSNNTYNNVDSVENEYIDADIFDTHSSDNQKKQLTVGESSEQKGIKRITLFFSDGSFEEFFPPR